MATGLFNLKQVNQAISQNAWVTGTKPTAVDFLVVAGGAGAGAANPGGGGAGGLLVGSTPVVSGSAITVTIGAGGTGTSGTTAPGNGTNSVFGSQTAIGGGKGGNNSIAGGDGGSGGGATYIYPGGRGTANQGFAGGTTYVGGGGGASGGGGGAGGVGQSPRQYNVAGQGGNGLGSVITGTMTGYGGGGDGSYGNVGSGYSAGGAPYGGGGIAPGSNGGDGTVNTGGGGGAGPGYTGGTGGSGVVVISYPDTFAAATATTGSPTVSTSGSGSVAFSSSAYIRYAGQSAFAFGTGDFTIEGWFYVTSFASGIIAWDFRTAGVNGAYGALELTANGQVQYYANSAYQISSSAGLNTINTWAHIAVTRSGTSTKLFFNGTQVGSTYSDSTNYLVGVSSPYIGSGSTPNAYLPGYISNFRVVKGTAVYTSNFTPPTAPLTAISGTSLLLSSASGAYLADGSTNSFVPAATAGTVAWNSASPFTVTGYKNRVYRWTSSGSITF